MGKGDECQIHRLLELIEESKDAPREYTHRVPQREAGVGGLLKLRLRKGTEGGETGWDQLQTNSLR